MPSRRLPPARNLNAAIEGSPSLSALLAAHRRAADCFECVRPAIPAALRSRVRPGPIDGAVWTLFADNGSTAAKLRQCLPDLLQNLATRDRGIAELKIKIFPGPDTPDASRRYSPR